MAVHLNTTCDQLYQGHTRVPDARIVCDPFKTGHMLYRESRPIQQWSYLEYHIASFYLYDTRFCSRYYSMYLRIERHSIIILYHSTSIYELVRNHIAYNIIAHKVICLLVHVHDPFLDPLHTNTQLLPLLQKNLASATAIF